MELFAPSWFFIGPVAISSQHHTRASVFGGGVMRKKVKGVKKKEEERFYVDRERMKSGKADVTGQVNRPPPPKEPPPKEERHHFLYTMEAYRLQFLPLQGFSLQRVSLRGFAILAKRKRRKEYGAVFDTQ
jgi:hypothetical protein